MIVTPLLHFLVQKDTSSNTGNLRETRVSMYIQVFLSRKVGVTKIVTIMHTMSHGLQMPEKGIHARNYQKTTR